MIISIIFQYERGMACARNDESNVWLSMQSRHFNVLISTCLAKGNKTFPYESDMKIWPMNWTKSVNLNQKLLLIAFNYSLAHHISISIDIMPQRLN